MCKTGILMDMSRKCTPLSLLAPLVLCNTLTGCSPDFGDSEAGMALEDLASGQSGSRLAAQVPRPARESIRFTTGGEGRVADLYHPPRGARAGIILVPGVAARGFRDERVVAVANTLARLDFTVLVPDMPGVRRYRMRSSDVREVADSFTWLASRPALAPPGHIGIAGFSYGAGPVLLAAIQSDIREQVRFVLAVGGYYSLENVVTYLTTGHYRTVESAGTVAIAGHLPPHPYSKATFVRSNLDLLERPADREFFRSYAAYIIDNRMDEGEPLPVSLAPDAQAFYDLLTNPLPAQVPVLLERLPPRMRTELEGINPAGHDLSRLWADVILLHGRGDTLIPYTESIALADALPENQVQLFLIDGLAHVDFRPKAHDMPQLLGAMEALLAIRMPPRDQDR
ncbi:MAG: alpha/beta hydrolase [Gammaproteobacteria bacterium]|nr:MAG: alpha/beta hydrolase [Gammaproteobacteria bacterium]